MSNHPELNDTSSNPTGQFGYTAITPQEPLHYDFQRGGAPTAKKSIVISEWQDEKGGEYILLASYHPTTRSRTLQVLQWKQNRLRYDPIDLPSYAHHAFQHLADSLFFPATLPPEAS